MDGKTYEELLQDIAWEMGKRFGENAEAVFCAFTYPPERSDSVINTHDESGIVLEEVDQLYLSLIKEANELNRQSTQKLDQAVKIMRDMGRVNDGK
jgi:hypothetical protein